MLVLFKQELILQYTRLTGIIRGEVPPGNQFEALQGDRLGQCSIRINKQYRICFRIDEDFNLYDVEIVDYH